MAEAIADELLSLLAIEFIIESLDRSSKLVKLERVESAFNSQLAALGSKRALMIFEVSHVRFDCKYLCILVVLAKVEFITALIEFTVESDTNRCVEFKTFDLLNREMNCGTTYAL